MDPGRDLTDSVGMWIRRQTLAQARMPSMHPQALAAQRQAPSDANAAAAAAVPPAAGAEASETPTEAAARDGGFHESSYELHHGLLVSESDWPDDVTVPGALGER